MLPRGPPPPGHPSWGTYASLADNPLRFCDYYHVHAAVATPVHAHATFTAKAAAMFCYCIRVHLHEHDSKCTLGTLDVNFDRIVLYFT